MADSFMEFDEYMKSVCFLMDQMKAVMKNNPVEETCEQLQEKFIQLCHEI